MPMQPTGGDGTVIAGRYRLGPLLGCGGMAEVYDGFDTRLERPVAIKLLREALADNPDMRQRFEREARSAARLSHPCVVAVYDSGEDDGTAFLVMERLPGETLADRMRAGQVPAGWLAGVASDVLAALEAAHARGLVHRDIKPANILIDTDGRAKVADFGIAKVYRDDTGRPPGDPTDPLARDLTATGMVLGTVAYLSPEQIEGAPASPQSDLYALAVVLYEALAGRKPFVGDSAVAQARAAVDGGAVDIATLRPDVAPGLAAVIRRGMARDPAARYPSAAAMRADLEARRAVGADPTVLAPGAADLGVTRVMPGATQVLPGAGLAAAAAAEGPLGPPGRVRPPPPGPERRRGLAVAVAVVAAAVIVAALVALLLSHHSPSKTTATTVPTTSKATTPTTAVASTTTLDSVAQNLLSEAASFAALGTPGGDALASLLRGVAATPASGRAARATQAAESALGLLQSGSITTADYDLAVADLQAAGGTAPSTTTSPPTTTTTAPPAPTTTAPTPTTPSTAPGPPAPPGTGKGHGKGAGV
jgi:hypothetical protein